IRHNRATRRACDFPVHRRGRLDHRRGAPRRRWMDCPMSTLSQRQAHVSACTAEQIAARGDRKPVNLALQGGGAHGAFAWGVLARLLEDGRLAIDAISATSAGAMNAVAMAIGVSLGGREGAREKLDEFWQEISRAGQLYSPLRPLPWERWLAIN